MARTMIYLNPGPESAPVITVVNAAQEIAPALRRLANDDGLASFLTGSSPLTAPPEEAIVAIVTMMSDLEAVLWWWTGSSDGAADLQAKVDHDQSLSWPLEDGGLLSVASFPEPGHCVDLSDAQDYPFGEHPEVISHGA